MVLLLHKTLTNTNDYHPKMSSSFWFPIKERDGNLSREEEGDSLKAKRKEKIRKHYGDSEEVFFDQIRSLLGECFCILYLKDRGDV